MSSKRHDDISPKAMRPSRTKDTVDSLFSTVLSSMSLGKVAAQEDRRTLLVNKNKLTVARSQNGSCADLLVSESGSDYSPMSSTCELSPFPSFSKNSPSLGPISRPAATSPIQSRRNSGADCPAALQVREESKREAFLTDSIKEASRRMIEQSDDESELQQKLIDVLNNRKLLQKKKPLDRLSSASTSLRMSSLSSTQTPTCASSGCSSPISRSRPGSSKNPCSPLDSNNRSEFSKLHLLMPLDSLTEYRPFVASSENTPHINSLAHTHIHMHPASLCAMSSPFRPGSPHQGQGHGQGARKGSPAPSYIDPFASPVGEGAVSIYDNLGCNRPLEIINARADARTRNHTQATLRKSQSTERMMDIMSKSIQDKNRREERKLYAAHTAERKTIWIKVIHILNASQFIIKNLPVQIKENRISIKATEACATIVRILRENRRLKAEAKRIRIMSVMKNFRFIISRLIKIWRLRRAADRIVDLLTCCTTYTPPLLSAAFVLRYIRNVKLAQRTVRLFLACRRARVTALSKMWDAAEFLYISNIVRTRILNMDMDVKSAQKKKNGADREREKLEREKAEKSAGGGGGGGEKDRGGAMLYRGNSLLTRGNSVLSKAGSMRQSSSSSLSSLKNAAMLSERWSSIDSKFHDFMRKTAQKKSEREVINSFLLPSDFKIAYLIRIIHNAQKEFVRQGCLTFKAQLQEVRNISTTATFNMSDAAILLQGHSDEAYLSSLKNKLDLVESFAETGRAGRKKNTFIFYRVLVESNEIYRCVKEAHESNCTFNLGSCATDQEEEDAAGGGGAGGGGGEKGESKKREKSKRSVYSSTKLGSIMIFPKFSGK